MTNTIGSILVLIGLSCFAFAIFKVRPALTIIGILVVIFVGVPVILHDIAATNAISEAKLEISSRLIDPSSAQFEFLNVYGDKNDLRVCGLFNARNGFGGYAGRRFFMYEVATKSLLIIKNDTDLALNAVALQARCS